MSPKLPRGIEPPAGRAHVLLRELTAEDRERLLVHFLALGDEDRMLRFGQRVANHVIENYVRNIDYVRDTLFGVVNSEQHLVGVGHLACPAANGGNRTAELGISVLEEARGQGVGTKLFERAAMRSRNVRVTTFKRRARHAARVLDLIAPDTAG